MPVPTPEVNDGPMIHWFCVLVGVPLTRIQLFAAKVLPFSKPPSPEGEISGVCAFVVNAVKQLSKRASPSKRNNELFVVG